MRTLRAEAVDAHVRQYLKENPENLRRLVSAPWIPPVLCPPRLYSKGFVRHHSFRLLLSAGFSVKGDGGVRPATHSQCHSKGHGSRYHGIRNYVVDAGLRGQGKSVAELVLEDIDWSHSIISKPGG
jgi:hypothetical protein